MDLRPQRARHNRRISRQIPFLAGCSDHPLDRLKARANSASQQRRWDRGALGVHVQEERRVGALCHNVTKHNLLALLLSELPKLRWLSISL